MSPLPGLLLKGKNEGKYNLERAGLQRNRDGGGGLFYYAGHDIPVEGRNYLIPLGAVIESEGDVRFETVDSGFVLAKMEDAGNDMNIVVLDVCRNNPFSRVLRSGSQGLARMDEPKGSIIAYATASGELAKLKIKNILIRQTEEHFLKLVTTKS